MNFFIDEFGIASIEYTVFMVSFSLIVAIIYAGVFFSMGDTFSILSGALTIV